MTDRPAIPPPGEQRDVGLSEAMTSAVGLVTRYLFGQTTAIIAGALVPAAFALVWFLLPLGQLRGPV